MGLSTEKKNGSLKAGDTKLQSKGEDLFLVSYDGSGSLLWAKRFGGPFEELCGGLAIDTQGNPVLAGRFGKEIDFGGGVLPMTGSGDVFVAKLDPAGSHQLPKVAHPGTSEARQATSASPSASLR